jgi:PAS domain S-box-containing protein
MTAQVPIAATGDLPTVIGTTNETLQVDRVSSEVEELLGYPPEHVLGKSVLTLVAREDVPKWLAGIAQATIARAGITMEVRVRAANGPALSCDAVILAMTPLPCCGFVLMRRATGADSTEADANIGEQLSRLRRGVRAVPLSPDTVSPGRQHSIPRLTTLSARELEIVGRLIAGDRVPAIANRLFVSQSTVRNHLAHVYHKLRVGSQQELIDLFRNHDTDVDAPDS